MAMVFEFSLPGADFRAAAGGAIVGSFATEAEIRQSFGKIMIFPLRGMTELMTHQLPRQISRFPGKKIARLKILVIVIPWILKDCTDTIT